MAILSLILMFFNLLIFYFPIHHFCTKDVYKESSNYWYGYYDTLDYETYFITKLVITILVFLLSIIAIILSCKAISRAKAQMKSREFAIASLILAIIYCCSIFFTILPGFVMAIQRLQTQQNLASTFRLNQINKNAHGQFPIRILLYIDC